MYEITVLFTHSGITHQIRITRKASNEQEARVIAMQEGYTPIGVRKLNK